MKLSIRNKLLLFLIVPLAIVLSGVVIVVSGYVENILLSDFKQNYGAYMYSNIRLFNTMLKNGVTLTDNTASLLKEVNKYDEAEIKNLLVSIINSDNLIFGAEIAFEPSVFKGRERFDPFYFKVNDSINYIDIGDKQKGYDYRDGTHSWYSVPMQTGKSIWTEPFYSGVVKGKKIITYSTPIISQGKMLGILAINYDLQKLDSFLNSAIKSETRRFVIFSREGKYISHPDEKRILTKTLFTDSESIVAPEQKAILNEKCKSGTFGYVQLKMNGSKDELIAFYAPLEIAGWSMVAYETEDALLKPIVGLFRNLFIILISFFFIGFALVTFLINKSLSPIKIIQQFSAKIASGKYPDSIKIDSKDEFEDLINDLNYMNSTLQKRENDLRALNQELEQRVEDRTMQLNESLNVARKLSTAVEQSPVLITITDMNGLVEYVNPEFERVTGFVADEVIGKEHTLMRTNILSKEQFEKYKRIIESGRKVQGEFESRKKDDSKYWVRISGAGVNADDGGVNSIVFVEDDITLTKNAELQLKEHSDALAKKNIVIEDRNKYISDSINYAKKIQDAILPGQEYISSFLPNYFLIFLPKDVVSGDFCWINKVDNRLIVAQVDCTGHGVPGALMSMICNTLLNEVVLIHRVIDPAEILERINLRLIEELHKGGQQNTRDGMDVAIIVVDYNNKQFNFSGAYRPLLYQQGDEIFVVKGDRKSIGDSNRESVKFTTKSIPFDEKTRVFLFSDGIVDQQNSENQKFGIQRFKNIITENSDKSMQEIKSAIIETLLNHKGAEIQRDDISVFGFDVSKANQPEKERNFMSFNGAFTHEYILKIKDDLTERLSTSVPHKQLKDIIFIAMELAQNIGFYSEDKETLQGALVGKGELVIEINEKYAQIAGINQVTSSQANNLSSSIAQYATLDRGQLKELAKIRMKENTAPDSKGAGIGLIEIAKRCNGQLSYEIDATGGAQDFKITSKISLDANNG